MLITGLRLLKEFKNAKLVQRYLGHSDVATTLRYYVDACLPAGQVFPEDLTGQKAVVWHRIAKTRRGGRGVGGKVI